MSARLLGGIVAKLTEARLLGHHVDFPESDWSIDFAQELQTQVLHNIIERGSKISGWKVGLTSGAAHDLMGPGIRPFGFILAERTFASGASWARQNGPPMHVEPEICLEIGSSLTGEFLSVSQCREAVRTVRASFEINQSRVNMPGRNALFVADGLANWGLVVGTGREVAAVSSRSSAELSIDEDRVQVSSAGLIMDDPFLSLSRLCASLSRYGLGVEAGQYVITGAFFRTSIQRSGEYRATISGVGEVSLAVA
jgi:2-keto-4-pentenoate hydratase